MFFLIHGVENANGKDVLVFFLHRCSTTRNKKGDKKVDYNAPVDWSRLLYFLNVCNIWKLCIDALMRFTCCAFTECNETVKTHINNSVLVY